VGISSTSSEPVEKGSSAGPASGTAGEKYGGFGSDDIKKLGFNDKEQFGGLGAYDPYTKN